MLQFWRTVLMMDSTHTEGDTVRLVYAKMMGSRRGARTSMESIVAARAWNRVIGDGVKQM